jgi:hypothetical protein
MLALPALWYGGLSIMLATLPLLGARSWADVRRVAAQGRREFEASVAALSWPGHRRATEEPIHRAD